MRKRPAHGLDITDAELSRREELDDIRAHLPGSGDLRRRQRAGHGDHVELARAANDRHVDIRGNHQAGARVAGRLDLLHRERRAAAHEHPVAELLHGAANLCRIGLHAVRLLMVEREFENAHAAAHERADHAVEPFHRHAAKNRDQPFLFDSLQHLVMHHGKPSRRPAPVSCVLSFPRRTAPQSRRRRCAPPGHTSSGRCSRWLDAPAPGRPGRACRTPRPP